MINRLNSFPLTLIVLCMCLASCKPGVPRDVIQPDKMEKILYDYHVAQGLSQEDFENRDYNDRLYRLAVFKKHRITEAEFDSSLVYYMRHTEQLHAIYKKLSDRMNKEALALGASTSELNRYTLSNTGDTANIWTGDINAMLIPYAPYNKISFVIPADTAFYKGDKFLMGLSAKFLYQEGSRDAVLSMAVRYNNDSISARTIHMSSNNNYTVEIDDRDTLGVKEIRGFILLTKDKNASATTLKLMLLDNIHLVRFHKDMKNTNPEEVEDEDSNNHPQKESPKRLTPPNGPLRSPTSDLPHPNQQISPQVLDKAQSIKDVPEVPAKNTRR